MVITISCPSCAASFPVDPAKIPEAGVNVRCSQCSHVFRVERPAEETPPPVPEPELPSFDEPVAEAEPAEVEAPADEPAEDDWVVQTEDDGAGAMIPEVPIEDDTEPSFDTPAMDESPAEVDEAPAFQETSFEETTFDATPAEVEAPAPEPEPEPELEPEPEPELEPELEPEPEAPAEEAPSVQGFTFGQRDPNEKAKRLARVLVSDMIMYNPERHDRAIANGTLKEDFEEEIEKSYKEYVEQVGDELAESTDFWTEALNDVLAKGEDIF